MASLQESQNRFNQQRERLQSMVKGISRSAPSSNVALGQQQTYKKQHTETASASVTRLATPVKFSADTQRLQHINTIRKSSHGTRMKLVIDLLYEKREALTDKDIYNGCYVNIHDNKNEIYDSLRNNPKISFDGNHFSYKAKHHFKGKDGLLHLIRHNVEGLLVIDVKDSYPSVMDDLMALNAENLVWVGTSINAQEDVVYPNDPKALFRTDQDVKQTYFATELPRDFVDVEKELIKMGLKPATKTVERRAAAHMMGVSLSKSKTRKKQSRKFNIRKDTNAHLPELFQFTDC